MQSNELNYENESRLQKILTTIFVCRRTQTKIRRYYLVKIGWMFWGMFLPQLLTKKVVFAHCDKSR